MDYQARSLGLTAPDGEVIYEIFLRVISRPGVLGQIATLLGSLNVDIVGIHGQIEEKGEATIILYADCHAAKCTPEEVVINLRNQEPVRQVAIKPMEPIFFEHFYFPLTSGGRFRVFALSVDSFLSFQEALYDKFGSPLETLFHESGTSVGRSVVRRIRERAMRTPITKEVALSNFIAMFRTFGLGLLEVTQKDNYYHVSIREPLMSLRETKVIDSFSIGMVTGALEEIYGLLLTVKRPQYEGETRTLSFELHPR